MNVYQGGLPILPYDKRRRGQRGSGFIQTTSRHAIPVLQDVATHAVIPKLKEFLPISLEKKS